MKISILTYHFANNYGAVLQAYALCRALGKMGHEAKAADYFPEDLRHLYVANPFVCGRKKSIQGKIREMLGKTKKLNKCRKQFCKFEQFRRETGLCTGRSYKKEELPLLNAEYDCFITGSDQVWNDEITEETGAYFLDFVKKGKRRISYAASFGKREISGNVKGFLERELPKFAAVSVREPAALAIAAAYGGYAGKTACQTVDPVFLLDQEEWRAAERKCSAPKEYILFCSLKKESGIVRAVNRISQREGLPVLMIHPTCEYTDGVRNAELRDDVGPREFLYLIDHARCVVTDSFHATAFGILFGKRIVNVSDRGVCSRVEELLKVLDIRVSIRDCRLRDCRQGYEADILPGNGKRTDERIERERQRALEFLDNALEAEETV